MTIENTMQDSPTVIAVKEVSKRFVIHQDKSIKDRVLHPRRTREHAEDFWALRNVSIDIKSGNTIGLIGPNGSGKSTLLKIIGGILAPSDGEVLHRGRIAALLELGAGFHQDLTGRENIYLNASILGLSKEQTDEYFDEIVAFSGIEQFIDTQVKFYSSGMYVRLAFAVAVHVDPDILLVDEVLAVGDEAFQQKCLDKIRSFQEEGRTIIMVTHTLSQITEFCTRALVLGHGNVVFDGAPEEAVEILRSGFESLGEADKIKERLARERRLDEADAARQRLGQITAIRAVLPGDELRPGDDLHVEVDLDVAADIPNWNLGLTVTNAIQQMALMTSARRAGLAGTTLPAGQHTLKFALPNMTLPHQEYTLTAALYDASDAEISRVDNAASFVAASDDRSTGLMYTPATASID
ncbi:ABC transporter ATP-binding protein [Gulosibacter faecalis]|jgi:ABC-2 type transport system ATP-binding protein|uniref:ABC transporter ATP-binding protein n=1 Tax=Gulosibacter faecalis TaxID=272240 RepID=A0ABW5UTM9_9MICO|nr:ABC transporter ATP-binding protein [Gulosibacter faecalis]